MKNYEINEIGNGPWCDPVEAVSIEAASEVVEANLRDSNPADYVDDWRDGDDWPAVEVIIRDIETGEEIKRTIKVGH